jgi:hypothetical protein
VRTYPENGFDGEDRNVQKIYGGDLQGIEVVRRSLRRTGRRQPGEDHRGSEGQPAGGRGALSGEFRLGGSAGKHRRGGFLPAGGRRGWVSSPFSPGRIWSRCLRRTVSGWFGNGVATQVSRRTVIGRSSPSHDELAKGTLLAILKQCGLSRDELEKMTRK